MLVKKQKLAFENHLIELRLPGKGAASLEKLNRNRFALDFP